MDEYKKYEPIFGSWYLSRLIGRGSFGKVFEITREEYGKTYRAALKVISVPQDDDDVKMHMSAGNDAGSISEYYEEILKEIINENDIMSKLKGNSNIVSYEDHQIIPHEDGIGYDILIRMELLAPLLDRMVEKKLDEKEVVKLGIDMCKALELCHRKNIIHRDIKPQNIFISDNGDFKLGDFGIARTMEKTTGGMSRKGTYDYMAPEVFRGVHYDSTVDLYSLGIVLFSLLNGNRGPFLPAPPAKVSFNEKEAARTKRFNGEPIPAPRDAGVMLTYIIKKACEADPKKRYRTAAQMKKDLESYLENYEEQRTMLTPEAMAAKTGGYAAPQADPRYTGQYAMPPQADPRFTGQYAMPPQADPRYTGQYAMPPQVDPRFTGQYAMPPMAAAQPARPAQPVRQTGKKKGSNKGLKITVAVLALLVLAGAAGLFMYFRTPETIQVDIGVIATMPEFSGYDEGYGIMSEEPVIDETEKNRLMAKIKKKDRRDAALDFFDSIEIIPDMTEELSNGDEIYFLVKYDAALAEAAGFEVIGTEYSVEVEGLADFPYYLEDATEYNGHFYLVVNESMCWDEAEAECEEVNGYLATITDIDEQEFIVSLIEENQGKYNYWLGGFDAGHEGEWEWITGEPWSYANWRDGQPDNGVIGKERAQDYLQICLVSKDDPGRYAHWWDNSNDGISKNYTQAPYYKHTDYAGYIIEWDGLED